MLQHVTLEVRPDQVRDCVRFWELLGFTELLPPPTLRDRFTWVGLHDTHIHLVPMDEPAIADQGHYAIVADDGRSSGSHIRSSVSREDFTVPFAIPHTVSTTRALNGVEMPCFAPRVTTSPFRKSIAGFRPRSIAASIDDRILR